MMTPPKRTGLSPEGPSEFEKAAGEAPPGLLAELKDFLVDNKKWWLGPILVCMLGLGALVILGGSGAAPFIYTLF